MYGCTCGGCGSCRQAQGEDMVRVPVGRRGYRLVAREDLPEDYDPEAAEAERDDWLEGEACELDLAGRAL